jgi:hypothetical protein
MSPAHGATAETPRRSPAPRKPGKTLHSGEDHWIADSTSLPSRHGYNECRACQDERGEINKSAAPGTWTSRLRGSGSQLARSDAAVSEFRDKVVPAVPDGWRVGGGYSVGTPGAPLRIRGIPLGCRRRGGTAMPVVGRLAHSSSVSNGREEAERARRQYDALPAPQPALQQPQFPAGSLVSQADGQPGPDQLGDQPVGQRAQVQQPTPICVVCGPISRSSRRTPTMPRGATPCSTMPTSRRVGFFVEGRHE